MSPDPANNRHRLPASRRAFSLVEAVVAMGVMAILLLGMSGALTMSVTALDKGKDASAKAVAAAAACDTVMADLNEATSVTANSAAAITLSVPDRDGDKSPDVISYRWSGARGDPLYRTVNGNEQVLVAGVDQLTINLFGRSGSASADGAESVLASFDTSLGATIKSVTVSGKLPAAQYIKPAFAANVDSWTITRLRIRLARDSNPSGTLRVSIVRDNAWTPTGDLLAKLDIPEAALPAAAAWVDIAIGAGPLSPDQGVFIRLEDAVAGSDAGSVEYGSGGSSMPYNTYFTTSPDYGATWTTPQDTQDMRFFVYGTVASH
jgi:type II secretory pathway pseudopilin PulG